MVTLLQLNGHAFTPKYDGNLRPVQFFLPTPTRCPVFSTFRCFMLPERQLTDGELNGRIQESVTVYIYRTICFDRALFNEAGVHCGLHMF
jgi:hypothetical protein